MSASSPQGFNPLRWDCSEKGVCFNRKYRPKIELFAECLPGKLAFTDIDQTAEVNGHFLYVEWKSGEPRNLPTGQRIYAERLTCLSDKITYVFVCGDAETMEVTHYCSMSQGVLTPWQRTSFEWLKQRIKRWANKAMRSPSTGRPSSNTQQR